MRYVSFLFSDFQKIHIWQLQLCANTIRTVNDMPYLSVEIAFQSLNMAFLSRRNFNDKLDDKF